MSIVSSADIDAVVLHLFAVALHMPRKENGDFCNDVVVVLKKPGWQDLYHITQIIRVLERGFQDRQIAQKIAMALCMAGNDFLPKFHGMTHLSFLKVFCQHSCFQEGLIDFNSNTINKETLLTFLKYLYCPNSLDPERLTYDEVRQLTIKPPKSQQKGSHRSETTTFTFVDGQIHVRHPNKWLIPASCAERLASLYDSMLIYLQGLGKHDACLPDFRVTCLTPKGQYDLGPESRVHSLKDLLTLQEDQLLEKKKAALSRKRILEFSPRKDNKRRPKTSTPKKLNMQ